MSAVHAHGHEPPPLPKHEFLAGRLSLDFCNSLSRGPGSGPRDRIGAPRDFLGWAARCGIALERAPSAAALARLHKLRAALLATFDAASDGQAPRPADLARFNRELATARAAERLKPGRDGYVLEDNAAGIDRFRNALLRDAADLLTGDPARIKRCPNHECRWLFHDSSKNLSRRWCAMDDCGTRDKVRRFRERAS